MRFSEARYKQLLQSYLEGSTTADAVEAASIARQYGEMDYIFEIANEMMGRRIGRYRRTHHVPAAVLAQALRIGVQSIQVPQAERILGGFITTPGPITHRALLSRLGIPYNSSIHRWLPCIKTAEEAETCLDHEGNLPCVGVRPRAVVKDAVLYSKGGLPPSFFYDQDHDGRSFFRVDSRWERRHVLSFDPLSGMSPIQLLWDGFWSREALIPKGEKHETGPGKPTLVKADEWRAALIAAVS